MHLDRIIRHNELTEFQNMLQPHQQATTADGMLKFLRDYSHTLSFVVLSRHKLDTQWKGSSNAKAIEIHSLNSVKRSCFYCRICACV